MDGFLMFVKRFILFFIFDFFQPGYHRIFSLLSAFVYGHPSRDMIVVGVTGTNGKTTCTHLMAQALDQAPTRCALIGTLGSGFPDALNTPILTTPAALTIAMHPLGPPPRG